MHIDIICKGLDIGIMYLDSSYHIKHETQLEQRLEYMKKGSAEQSGKTVYLAYMMDHKEANQYISQITLLCLDYRVQVVPLKGYEDLKVFLLGLNRQAYPLLRKTAI